MNKDEIVEGVFLTGVIIEPQPIPNNVEITNLICDLCSQQGTQIQFLTRSYGKGANLLVIENVPVIVYPHYGESYLTSETLHELEHIKLHRHSLA